MRRILAIAGKEVRVAFRDPVALLFMLVMPLALALMLGFAFGGLGQSGNSASTWHARVVDLDGGLGGQAITSVLTSADVATIVTTTVEHDPAAARKAVDDNAAAAVIIPAGLSDRLTTRGPSSGQPLEIEIYANPTQVTGASVVRTIVDGVLSRLGAGSAAAQVTIRTLVNGGYLSPTDASSTRGLQIASAAAAQAATGGVRIGVGSTTETSNGGGFDYGSIVGPSMAILFLMFTVTTGGRKLLDERQAGTLSRLLTTPTTMAQVLGGKAVGIYLTGAAQMAILLVVTSIIFDINWGSIVAVVLLTAALVLAATGWGVLIAGLARTSAQASQAGAAISLTFAMMAGNFVPRQNLPEDLKQLSLVTPNAWGLEGYGSILSGGGVEAIAVHTAVLTAMAAALFIVAAVAARRRLTAI